MHDLIRVIAVCAVVLASAAVHAQELPSALAERFSAGVAALKAGEADRAEQVFREVLQQGGERSFVRHNLGIALQQRGRHREALAEFRAAIKLDPAFGPSRLLAGTSLLALGRSKEAVAALERAVRLMPEEPLAPESREALELKTALERARQIP